MLVTVKGDWEKSGNGDGCVKNIVQGDDKFNTYDELEVIDGEDKKRFEGKVTSSAIPLVES